MQEMGSVLILIYLFVVVAVVINFVNAKISANSCIEVTGVNAAVAEQLEM
jgi:hypothetical protein